MIVYRLNFFGRREGGREVIGYYIWFVIYYIYLYVLFFNEVVFLDWIYFEDG